MQNYKVVNDYKKTVGTCFISTINITYSDLLAQFGEPKIHDHLKDHAEWIIEFDNGEIVTIYDYTEDNFTSLDNIIVWHVGGKSKDTLYHLVEILN